MAEFKSSELRAFARNEIWKSLYEEGMFRLAAQAEEADQIDPVKDPTTIARYQGAKGFALWFFSQLEIMTSEAELEEKKEAREEREDGPDVD